MAHLRLFFTRAAPAAVRTTSFSQEGREGDLRGGTIKVTENGAVGSGNWNREGGRGGLIALIGGEESAIIAPPK